MLKTANVYYKIGKKQVLTDVSETFEPGQCTIILGPNGSGKSSFLKIFSGHVNDFNGTVLYDGQPISMLPRAQLARYRAVMSQQPELSFPLTVDEVVMMGRYPHFTFNPGKKDFAICQEVMEKLSLQDFRHRNYLTLSGGEKQRVQFARVLAQIWEPPLQGNRYLFLDEPIASLDIRYQHEFLQVAKNMAAQGAVVIAVLHDINLSIQYGDKLVFMKEGRLVNTGSPAEVVTTGLLLDVFGIAARIMHFDNAVKPLVIFSP